MNMKKTLTASFIASTFFACNVFALDIPTRSEHDPRIQYVNYNAGDVVQVNAQPGIGTRIVFDESEKIISVHSGFSSAWQNERVGNMLIIKPITIRAGETTFKPTKKDWATNMIVTTNKRLYDFDLRLVADHNKTNKNTLHRAAYRVQFRYPEQERKAKQTAIKQSEIQEKLAYAVKPENDAYFMKVGENSQRIAPTEAFDDGRFTYLRFPGNYDMPAVFVFDENGDESLVNTHIDPKRKDTLVVHRIAKTFVLRFGKKIVGVYNQGYDAHGIPAEHNTTIYGVKRVLKGASND